MKFNGVDFDTYLKDYPNQEGFYGRYGGSYVSVELQKAMEEITEAYYTIAKSSKFISELRRIRKEFQGVQHRYLIWNGSPIRWAMFSCMRNVKT